MWWTPHGQSLYCEDVNTVPRYFWVVLSVCALALTVATALHLRYVPLGSGAHFDTWKNTACAFQAECR